jgi:hypothetical protein
MTIVIDVAKEIVGMFLSDIHLTIAILILVTIVAGVVCSLPINPLWGGGLLLLGCLAILVGTVRQYAKSR